MPNKSYYDPRKWCENICREIIWFTRNKERAISVYMYLYILRTGPTCPTRLLRPAQVVQENI